MADDTFGRLPAGATIALLVLLIAVASVGIVGVAIASSHFEVDYLDHGSSNSPVVAGEDLRIEYYAENHGSSVRTEQVFITVTPDGGGSTVYSETDEITLSPGSHSYETMLWQTVPGDEGEYTVEIQKPAGGGVKVFNQQVLAPASFTISNVSMEPVVMAGQSLPVSVTVQNDGAVPGAETISLRHENGTELDTVDTGTLNESNTTDVELTWETTPIETGETTLIVDTGDDNRTLTVSFCDGTAGDFDGGTGSEANPYQVASAEQLQCLNHTAHTSAHASLAGDIDATATWLGADGFDPIASGAEFSGTFDGNGHAITNLSLDHRRDNVGVFGSLGPNGSIANVTLANISVTGGNNTGILVGRNDGSVTNASARGEVTGGRFNVGGLVGLNAGGMVTESSAFADVTGSDARVGGLIGRLSAGTVTNSSANGSVHGINNVGGLVGWTVAGTVIDSHANGTVTGNNSRIGGLIGNSAGSVIGSSSNATVTGTTDVGGLVGRNGGNVTTSAATGTVSGDGRIGGLVGINNGIAADSNASATVTATGDGSGGLVGLNNGVVINATAGGTVTSDGRSVGGLVGEGSSGSSIERSTATGHVSSESSWVGGLVGSNYGTVTDSRATADVEGTDSVGGLIGTNQGPVANSTAEGAVEGNTVGGLVGYNDGGAITNSSARGPVSGPETGGSAVGGLIGWHAAGSVSNAYATGNVSAPGSSSVGGLIGVNLASVMTSYAVGPVTGASDVGGLIGSNPLGSVSDSFWNVETTTQPTSAGGTARTTSEMTGLSAATNMSSFDFGATWNLTAGYPRLVWEGIPSIDTEPIDASFETSIVSAHRGDVVRIAVSLSNTSTISGSIGSPGANYVTDFTAADNDGDGQVTILFNTYLSGTADDPEAITAAGADTATGSAVMASSPVLPAGDYNLNLTAGGSELDVGTLIVEERSGGDATAMVAPSLDPPTTDRATILENSSLSSTVTSGDVAVAEFSAVSGLEGFFNETDVNDIEGFNLTFSQVDGNGSFSGDAALGTNVTVLEDLTNDTFYVMWSPPNGTVEQSGEWNVTYTIDGAANDATPDQGAGPEESATATFTLGSAPVWSSTLENDGNFYALGFPGPTNATLTDLFPSGFGGVQTAYVYDTGWEQLTDTTHTFGPLDVVVVTTSGSGGDIPVEIPLAADTNASNATLEPGWSLVSSPAQTDAESAFADEHTLIVLDRFEPISIAGTAASPFESYVIGSADWGATAPTVSPFGGYFVFSSGPAAITVAASDVSSREEANQRLGIDP